MTAVGGLLFPQAKSLGIDPTEASPALQEKIVDAGVARLSFAAARATLDHLADLSVNAKQVERLTARIGDERVDERAAAWTAFRALPLVEKFAAPPGVTPPNLAGVMADGGRLQILDRTAAPAAAQPTAVAAPVAPAPEPDWEAEPAAAKGHWREDKVGLLLTMTSAVVASDPCPDIPASFLDVVCIRRLARQLTKTVAAGADAVTDPDDPEAADAALPVEAVYEPPQGQTRQVVAWRRCGPQFAPLLAAAAWALGFQGAARKAFVGDGSANHWTLPRRFFGSFVPMLDFIHALCYVCAAAMAGRPFALGWACYQQWLAWVWQGQVSQGIEALRVRPSELGVPTADESSTSPAAVVSQTLGYLQNHQDTMKYDEYRKAGLPIPSSLRESAVKPINQGVKGTEKFWSEAGREAVLQLRADLVSDGAILETFWARRQAQATGQRRYRHSA